MSDDWLSDARTSYDADASGYALARGEHAGLRCEVGSRTDLDLPDHAVPGYVRPHRRSSASMTVGHTSMS